MTQCSKAWAALLIKFKKRGINEKYNVYIRCFSKRDRVRDIVPELVFLSVS
jgi:hypothetical protein